MDKTSIKNLPKEFRLSYQISELFYNNIVSNFNSCIDSKIFEFSIKIKSKRKVNEIKELNSEELYNWLFKNNYLVEHFMLTNKLLIRALISDYLTYLNEALINILKGNLIITYTLLRKPFKEILSLFEIIYTDPYKFYDIFYKGENKGYNPKNVKPESKLELIEKVIQNSGMLQFFSSQIVYELRFDRSKHFSYDAYCNKAIHLITNASSIETEKHNLNLIFSDEEDKYFQLEHIFQTLPIVLYYSSYLIEEVLKIFANSPAEEQFRKRIDLGMLLWSYDVHLSKISKQKVIQILNEETSDMKVYCPKCKNNIPLNKKFLYNFSLYWIIRCNKCSNEIDMGKDYKLPSHWK